MTARLRLPIFLVATALAGCVAGPPPEIATPVPQLPASFLYQPSGTVEAELRNLLPVQDSAFAAFLSAASLQSPTLLEAAARVDAARADAAGAGAERLPSVSASGLVQGSRTNPGQFGADLPPGVSFDTTRVQYGANVTANWDPDVFGRLRAREQAAVALADASEADRAAVFNALVAEIAAAVVDRRTLTRRETAIRRDLADATELARLAEVREEAGIAPGFDRVRAETSIAAAQSRLDALSGERARLLGRLVTLTTLPTATVEQAFSVEDAPPARSTPPVALPSDLLVNRPDIQAATARLAASDFALAATAAQRFPSFDLSAVIGLLAFGIGGQRADAIVGTLSAGVAAPLLDFGRIEAEITNAGAEKRAAFQRYRSSVYQALGEAETGYALVAATDREADSIGNEAALADRQARLADTRFRAGLADYLTVLDAQRTAAASRERSAAADGRAQRARVLLWQALGGGDLGD